MTRRPPQPSGGLGRALAGSALPLNAHPGALAELLVSAAEPVAAVVLRAGTDPATAAADVAGAEAATAVTLVSGLCHPGALGQIAAVEARIGVIRAVVANPHTPADARAAILEWALSGGRYDLAAVAVAGLEVALSVEVIGRVAAAGSRPGPARTGVGAAATPLWQALAEAVRAGGEPRRYLELLGAGTWPLQAALCAQVGRGEAPEEVGLAAVLAAVGPARAGAAVACVARRAPVVSEELAVAVEERFDAVWAYSRRAWRSLVIPGALSPGAARVWSASERAALRDLAAASDGLDPADRDRMIAEAGLHGGAALAAGPLTPAQAVALVEACAGRPRHFEELAVLLERPGLLGRDQRLGLLRLGGWDSTRRWLWGDLGEVPAPGEVAELVGTPGDAFAVVAGNPVPAGLVVADVDACADLAAQLVGSLVTELSPAGLVEAEEEADRRPWLGEAVGALRPHRQICASVLGSVLVHRRLDAVLGDDVAAWAACLGLAESWEASLDELAACARGLVQRP